MTPLARFSCATRPFSAAERRPCDRMLALVGRGSSPKRQIPRDGERREEHELRNDVVGALCAMAGILTCTPAGKSEPAVLDLRKYRLIFAENFNKLDVSAWGPGTRWIAHTPWNGDFGDAQFVDPQPGFPFTIKAGVLRIEARKGSDGKWRSGLLSSVDSSGVGFSQQYGYFEMRAKLPPGPGVWPAFWLSSIKAPEPGVEIDALEYYGQFPSGYHMNTHVWSDGRDIRHESFTTAVPSGALSSGFHDYGVSVEPDQIAFYFDRKEVASAETPPEHRRPLGILLDLALGSGWPIDQTLNPSFMDVEYVRVYSR